MVAYIYLTIQWRRTAESTLQAIGDRILQLERSRQESDDFVRMEFQQFRTLTETMSRLLERNEALLNRVITADHSIQLKGADGKNHDNSTVNDASSKVPSIAERRQRADQFYSELRTDGALNQLCDKFKDFNKWTPTSFTTDPQINSKGIELTPDEEQLFEEMLLRAQNRAQAVELKRRLLIANAVQDKIEEALAARDSGLEYHEILVPKDLLNPACTVSFNQTEVMLSRDEYPEIPLLNKEYDLAIGDWIKEARGFFSTP
jgi:hypothetical protein